MRYRCDNCGTEEWRGFFPKRMFHPRYAIFHGIALGVSSCVVHTFFDRMSYKTEGFRGGMAVLGACLVVMLVIYGLAVMLELFIVAARGCRGCRSHKMIIAK